MQSRLLVAVAFVAALAGLQGCADLRTRPPQGLEWHLQNEAQKRELTRQGFDQYSPAP